MSSMILDLQLKRDSRIVLAAIVLLTALAWTSLLENVRRMPAIVEPMSEMHAWRAGDLAILFPMWAIMMVAMMTPSVTPMLLMYARVARESAKEGNPLAATGWFTAGYLLSWTAFSLAAAAAHGLLERAAWLNSMNSMNSMMTPADSRLAGAALIGAGLYQFTPLKDNCLTRCQSPLAFLRALGGFKPGAASAIRLGIRHGLYCIGCCWALVALLFVGGVMNVYWILAISTHLVIERVLLAGHVIARLTGAVLAIAGLWLLFK